MEGKKGVVIRRLLLSLNNFIWTGRTKSDLSFHGFESRFLAILSKPNRKRILQQLTNFLLIISEKPSQNVPFWTLIQWLDKIFLKGIRRQNWAQLLFVPVLKEGGRNTQLFSTSTNRITHAQNTQSYLMRSENSESAPLPIEISFRF